MSATLDDRSIADTVNLLRDIAIEFHDAQQLRERIAGVVVPLLKAEQSTEMMADCMNMVREELIEADIVDKTVPPMMVSNAVVAYVSRIEREAKRYRYLRDVDFSDSSTADIRGKPWAVYLDPKQQIPTSIACRNETLDAAIDAVLAERDAQ